MSTKKDNQGQSGISRRGLFKGAAAGAMAIAATQVSGAAQAARPQLPLRRRKTTATGPAVTKGRIKQSVANWCFMADCSVKPWSLDELCRNAVALGIKSVELTEPSDWPTLKKHGLISALSNSHGFAKGFNDKKNHAWCIDIMKKSIDATSAAGFPNVITFPGFRNGIPDDVGMDNSVKGLKKIIGYAEKKNVTLILEVLNSRVDVAMKGHPGYMGDKVEWCVEVCKRVGSERMKILFDIYHVQVMQGDIITRIKKFKDYIGHYHTAGCPGRNELDDTQELNYKPIMEAIVETGYKGYVGQEFIPTRDPLQGLREAVTLCDV
jgi:hydroxypyruvate isomerase